MLKDLYVELTLFQERMHSQSKRRFRDYLENKAKEIGYESHMIPKSIFSKNVVIGNLESAEYILTAHYDTPPRMPYFLVQNVLFFNLFMIAFTIIILGLSILLSIPMVVPIIILLLFFGYNFGFPAISNKYNFNDNTSGVLTLLFLMNKLKNPKVAYVFFDNEEKGLFGSIGLSRYLHKSKLDFRSRKFINFDCVGVGNVFSFDHFKKPQLANQLKKVFDELNISDYECEVRKGSAFELSDHLSFAMNTHVGIFALTREKKKLVLKNVHSHRDRTINLNNILVIAKTIETFINQRGEPNGANLQKNQ
ncbi:MAG: M28 family peptidase [Bacilli bacterium]|nr:M28 family peptidase [Bacilli bacterium]